MKYLLTLALLASVLASAYSAAEDAVPPDPRVKQIVEELELPRSDTAMRDNPNWHPQRIVASVPAGVAQQMPELEALLRKSAGTVELVIDKSIPETHGLEWTDSFFHDEDGIVAVFDFDYAQMVDFNTKTAAVGQLTAAGCMAVYGGVVAFPYGLLVPVAYSIATLWPCFLRAQVEWEAHAQHVAVTRDGIRFVQDQRKACWGLSVCDKGRHSKTVPFDKITDCDLVEPAGSVALCIPRVLLTVNVDTASSGGEGKRNELRIVGLKDAHKFKQLVWAMKRASRGGADFGGSADVYYTAPQALEMAESAFMEELQQNLQPDLLILNQIVENKTQFF